MCAQYKNLKNTVTIKGKYIENYSYAHPKGNCWFLYFSVSVYMASCFLIAHL